MIMDYKCISKYKVFRFSYSFLVVNNLGAKNGLPYVSDRNIENEYFILLTKSSITGVIVHPTSF